MTNAISQGSFKHPRWRVETYGGEHSENIAW